MSLFHEFRELLTPRLAATIESNREFVDPNNLEAVLKKDAIYNAFGLTAFEMFDIVSILYNNSKKIYQCMIDLGNVFTSS